ncbi:hypothetical protein [Bordetella genomosp. 13]|uniref:Glycosyl transferase family 2 n=1 Tax=Bordetella genomosp. 13 TaxID=463040 RepID=A0A1W6Z966_9BORD|nr:hypothetical protein [Bordetella genomosp. 13]ARP93394.1 hypothetical protein CAL15_02755 [Bordetella genomosp. 13]
MLPDHLHAVCVSTGEAFDDLDIHRLYNMLRRHCPIPFTLHCMTDRPRNVPPAVQVHVLDDWHELERPDMRQTTKKLRLFAEHGMPAPEFLYMDVSLVIRSDMRDMLEFAFNSPADLVIVPHWRNEGFNSSVMRIRRGALSVIYDAFRAGEHYVQTVKGDQEFIYFSLRARNMLDRTMTFPDGQIISYKTTRRLDRKDHKRASARLANAIIVKFHGRPKPAQVLGGFWESLHARLRRSGNFGRRDLQEHWRLPASWPELEEPQTGQQRPIAVEQHK